MSQEKKGYPDEFNESPRSDNEKDNEVQLMNLI